MKNGEPSAADATEAESSQGEAAPCTPVWQASGQQRFYAQEDVLYWETHGTITVQDLKVFFEQRISLQRQLGHVFLLVDARDIESIPADARRYAVQHRPDPPLRGAIVVFGSGLLVRTGVSLILAASRLLGRRNLAAVFFVAEEVEARALIERERLALSATQPLS